MNKLLIGLLVVAAGAGVFFFLRKQEKTNANKLHKEWIVGKWKMNPPDPVDSNFKAFQFDFQKNGLLVQSQNDSVKADTLHYEWNKANELVWKKTKEDSIGNALSVVALTKDSLQVRGSDSVTVLLTRAK